MSWKEIYKQWSDFNELDQKVRTDLEEVENDEHELEDAFFAPLEFGTAGMRGVLGAGINRMNIYTIRQAAKGLALFIESLGEEAKKRGVAIAYDCRYQSKEFAMVSAGTLATHGIKSYVFESLRPTPELSYAVRELNCISGIMITASHNPSNYNGFKVYGEDGGQMPPKDADAVIEFVRSIENPLIIAVPSAEQEKEFVSIIGADIDEPYLEKVKSVTIDQELLNRSAKDLKLIFTPLHGTGKMLGEKALLNAGFTGFEFVPEQAVADPDFTTVKSPNPEDSAAFEYAIKLGKEKNADLLIATDPDADRLGAAVKLPNGEYQVLSGNQIGSLMLQYILDAKKRTGTLNQNSAALKSIVSSELATSIATKYDVEMINVLTGFKFIAEKIKEFEATGSHTFVFGFEESYGYLVQPFVRDKDAIQALVLIAEMTTYYKEQGLTLYDVLLEIYKEHGFYTEKTISFTFSGIDGIEKIKNIMLQLREQKITKVGDYKIAIQEDYDTDVCENLLSGEVTSIGLPKSNVLKYYLEDGSWFAVRPSGTEPKVKIYLSVKGDTKEASATKFSQLEEAITKLLQVN
ncbi:phospho-sugar mutase [Vagococcus silagei]|uniref:Phosphoglucomutase n=1 Tax=Vagococcus silagei TaxID=2508885 RepID=A0A4S3B042_9ENTE|nr:phospho-sugar mutase [Vagococcus silagei]THB60434.1 phospho-sugar mutase [Vagococcus silagei]